MAVSFQRSVEHICRACRAQQQFGSSVRLPSIYSQYLPPPNSQQQQNGRYRRYASTQTPQKPGTISSNAKTERDIPRKTATPAAVETQTVRTSGSRQISAQSIRTADTITPKGAADLTASLKKARGELSSLAASQTVDQPRVLEVLTQLYQIANQIVFADVFTSEERDGSSVMSSSLLADLDEPEAIPAITTKQRSDTSGSSTTGKQSQRGRMALDVSQTAYDLLKIPTVHIDEKVLESYVRIICSLNHPEFLPEIFYLYANKPVPIPGSNPIEYKTPNPSSASQAIPRSIADRAIDTAIVAKDLPLAIAIIDTTVATRAFRRNKFVKKATPALALGSVFPLAVYASADWLSHWQNTLEPSQAKAIGLAAGAAYVGTFGTIAYVALTTWNDHHERVRWVPGTPLHWRWTREEERLYFDRIAMAWGFQSKRRRGEETGEEWEALRFELGVRSFVLDQTDLLEGMQ